MKRQLLNFLCCPDCNGDFHLTEAHEINGEIETGQLVCGVCTLQYPIIRFIPRFVPTENYASNFGFQWHRFRQTQLDRYTGVPISRKRFFDQTGWSSDELTGKKVLDVGCGAGRFAEVALSCGADLVALEYSTAADACWENLAPHPGLNVVQGDIYRLPFKPGSFDFVYCFGVLQHTPNVQKAFMALPEHVREGGKLVVDVYPKLFLNILWPKYWLRPLTKRLNQESLFKIVEIMVKYLFPISQIIGRFPLLGGKLRHMIPVANYKGVYPLSKTQLREWAILDTFDMLSPVYDQPQLPQALKGWFTSAGFQQIKIFRAGVFVCRGVKGHVSHYIK